MNNTSISLGNTTKNALPSQSSSATKSVSDKESDGGFSSALSVVFGSDDKVKESGKVSNTKTSSDAEVKASSTGESIDSKDKKILTSDEEGDGKVQVVTAEGDETEVSLLEIKSSQKPATEELDTEPQLRTSISEHQPEKPVQVTAAIDEGNQLLERLGESNQAISKSGGKSLPQENAPSVDASALSRVIVEETESASNKGQKVNSDNEAISSLKLNTITSQSSAEEENRLIVQQMKTESGGLQKGAQDIQNSALGEADPLSQGKLVVDGTQTVEMKQGIQESGENGRLSSTESLTDGEEVVWTSRIGLKPETTQPIITDQVIKQIDVADKNELLIAQYRPQIEASLAELNITDVAIEDLSPEEIEFLVQRSASSPVSEVVKLSSEVTKPSTFSQASQGHLAAATQVQSTVTGQNMAAASAVDKAMIANSASSGHNDLTPVQWSQMSAMPVANSTAPQLNNANAQQQLMKGALATTGLVATKRGDRAENQEAGLSSQLSGLASQQGAQHAQIKAEMQQAIQHSPLQLSREAAGDKLSEQVQMMLSKNLKQVDIRLDPPELGRMQIRMSLHNDGAAVQFTVANQQARDIVEQAMPRLREMLAQQGVQLSDSSVHQQSSGQQQQYAAEDGAGKSNKNAGFRDENDLNLEENIKLGMNIKSKADGISYYA